MLNTRWETNALHVDVNVETAPAVLVVADSYRRGWRARVDGQRAKVIPADGLIKSVIIDPGRHTVRLTYMPPAFPLGALISAAAIMHVILFATGVVKLKRVFNQHPTPPGQTPGTDPPASDFVRNAT